MNEGVPDDLVSAAMGVTPNAEPCRPLPGQECWGVDGLGERAALRERQQNGKGRNRRARLAACRIDVDPPGPNYVAVTIRAAASLPKG